MKKIKYVIFDCDGVLIDSEILANRVEAEVKTELGFPITVEEQITKFTGLGMNHPVVQSEMQRLPAHYAEIVDTRIRTVYENELKPIAGVKSVLESLKLPMCVASSSDTEWLDIKLTMTSLKEFFPNAIFSGPMVERCKPEPDLFLHAMDKMNWNPQECLVVEDSLAGVQAGKAAGLTVCGFLGGGHIQPGHAEKLLKAGADYVISDFKNILRFF